MWDFCLYCITKLGHEPIALIGPDIVSLLNDDPAKTRVPFIIDVFNSQEQSSEEIHKELQLKFRTSATICDVPSKIPERINSLNEAFSPYKKREVSDYLRRPIDYIFNQIANPDLSLSAIINFSCTNKDKLENEFKRVYGKSVWQFVIDIRIQEAQRLLFETRYCISDVASAVGIPDPSVFGRAFQKITGGTPSNYRRKDEKSR